MIKLEIQALCQKGIVRGNNEDMVSVGGILLRNSDMAFPVELSDESQFWLLVADGLGGHEFGERASEGLLNYLNDCFRAKVFTSENIEDELRNHVKAYSDRLNQEAVAEGQAKPMGCTLTGVVWDGAKAYLLNAGDSRTYRLRNGILRQLTTDETSRVVLGHPMAKRWLLNCIGGGSTGRLAVVDISDRLRDGDQLLICSDGLTDMLQDDDIEPILSQSERAAQELYDAACQQGGRDNVSVIVAKIINAQH